MEKDEIVNEKSIDRHPGRSPLWDLTTRVLHWLLAGSVLACFISVSILPQRFMILHYWSGGVAGAVVVVRLVWGVVGSQYSRFRAFPISIASLKDNARSLLTRDGREWPGHPPLAAVAMLLMLALVAVMVMTGVVQLGGHEGMGPLRGLVSFAQSSVPRSIHSVVANLLGALIGLHLLGVLVESRLHKYNLAKSMITGQRKTPAVITVLGRPRLALPLAGAVLLGGGWWLSTLAEMPVRGTHVMAVNEDYVRECTACHWQFHPSLLPAASWRVMMGDLPHHFGQDASLSPELTAAITSYLVANANETWATKPAIYLRKVNPAEPTKIIATDFWKRRHHELPDELFKQRGIANKINCVACHRDAVEGRFAVSSIHIPGE